MNLTIPNDFVVSRVIVDVDGTAVSPNIAKHQYAIFPEIVFLRNDGWSLGAPEAFEMIAFDLWREDWTHFTRRPAIQWTEIENYIKWI